MFRGMADMPETLPMDSESLLPKSRFSNYNFMASVLPPPLQFQTSSPTTSSNPLNVIIHRFTYTGGVSSASIGNKFSKLLKTHTKLLAQEQEIIREINLWSSTITNEESRQLVIEFLKILQTEYECREVLNKKQDKLKLQFDNVYLREKKCHELRSRKEKTKSKLRNFESKSASVSEADLIKENLEEIEGSLKLTEDQFARTINSQLKSAFLEYVSSLDSVSVKYNKVCKLFFDIHFNNEGPKKYLLMPRRNHYENPLSTGLSNSSEFSQSGISGRRLDSNMNSNINSHNPNNSNVNQNENINPEPPRSGLESQPRPFNRRLQSDIMIKNIPPIPLGEENLPHGMNPNWN